MTNKRPFVSLCFAFVLSLSWQMIACHQEVAPATLRCLTFHSLV
eukprot:COSAG06_NODE_1069_length_10828_cov_22.835493_8_plen_44_part_00